MGTFTSLAISWQSSCFHKVDGESSAGLDGLVEGVGVSIELILKNCRVVFHDVVLDVAGGDPVEALVGVFQCGEHPSVERGSTYVDINATGVDIIGPVDIQYLVFFSESFTIGRICTRNYVRIR